MAVLGGTVCRCPRCQQGEDHPERGLHHQMNVLVNHLDEAQRRWYVGLESQRVGHGGDTLLSQITGLDEKTIQRGREELAASLADQPAQRVRRAGAGRPLIEKKTRR
ncbi:MAG: transposase [Chloroflexota bacterium]